jgi:hypothetical protein
LERGVARIIEDELGIIALGGHQRRTTFLGPAAARRVELR